MFNPNYDMEHSTYQHPTAATKQAKKEEKAAEQSRKEQLARDTMKKVRGRRGTWDTYEFA